MKKLSLKVLIISEYLFLWAHGWRRVKRVPFGEFGRPHWLPPDDHQGQDMTPHRLGHAVNSAKLHGYGGVRGTRAKGGETRYDLQ